MRLRNILLSILSTLSITACVGDTPPNDNATENKLLKAQITKNAKEKALEKIKTYAKNHDTNPEPTLIDYKNASISYVTEANIGGINNRIKSLTTNEITPSRIQTEVDIVNDVVDTEKPTISLIGDETITLTVGSTYTDAGSTASDSKDGDITGNITTTGTVDTNVAGTYTITYNTSDTAGNIADGVTRTITIENKMIPEDSNDAQKPSITLNGATSLELTLGESYTDTGATASDNKDGDVQVTTSGTVDISKVGTYTITYTAKDTAGNIAEAKRTVTVSEAPDTEKPSITLKGNASITLIVGEAYTDAGALANDTKDGNITANIIATGKVDTTKAGTYTITYNVSDAAANTAVGVTRTIIVNLAPDITNPTLTLVGSPTLTLTVGDTYIEQGAIAIDDKDGNITTLITIIGTVDTNPEGSYTLIYNVSDTAGNSATVTRTVIVINTTDEIAPTMTLNGEDTVILTVGTDYVEAGANAMDERDGNVSVVISGDVNSSTVGTYEVTYTATDVAGNETILIRTVVVTQSSDTTNPILTLVGNTTHTLTIGDAYIEQGAIASDSIDGNITDKITTTGTVDITTAGTYTITYNVNDAAGNTATEVTRTVIVKENNTNNAPTASNVMISGIAKIGETLTLNYDFNDEDGDSEGASIIVWSTATKELLRSTSKTFTIPTGYENIEIGAWVHPIDEHGLEMERADDYPASNNMLTILKENSNSNTKAGVPVVIIGDSTVRTAEVDGILYGWGDVISGIMSNPKNVFNHAESGKTSRSFFLNTPTYKTNGFWGDGNLLVRSGYSINGAKHRIKEVNSTNGGYLLMQFGHNDQAYDTIRKDITTVPRVVYDAIGENNAEGVTVYENNLMEYISYAIENNMVPVLLTPVVRSHIGNYNNCPDNWMGVEGYSCIGMQVYNKNSTPPYNNEVVNYPQAMRNLVTRLNTNTGETPSEVSSANKLKEMNKKALILELGDVSAKWAKAYVRSKTDAGDTRKDKQILKNDYIVDDTHYNKSGAQEIGKLIRNLACDALNGDIGLCNQFTQTNYSNNIQTRAWGQDNI